jgi:hypothetical protein
MTTARPWRFPSMPPSQYALIPSSRTSGLPYEFHSISATTAAHCYFGRAQPSYMNVIDRGPFI